MDALSLDEGLIADRAERGDDQGRGQRQAEKCRARHTINETLFFLPSWFTGEMPTLLHFIPLVNEALIHFGLGRFFSEKSLLARFSSCCSSWAARRG